MPGMGAASAAPRATVALERCGSYEPGVVLASVKRAVDALGGIGSFVRAGQKVLLKPNLLWAAEPPRAVNTHPAIVEAVIRLVKQAEGLPRIGDSPGLASAAHVAQKAGIAEVADQHNVPLVPFDEPVTVPPADGQLFRQIEIARAVVEADVLISLPKVKTHGQMLLTLAVKNLFGCVVGRRKAQWHLRVGRDHELFARLLVEVCRASRPAIHIADAVVAMEGNGPSGGEPVELGFVAASADPVALDSVVGRILGVEPQQLLTTRIGAQTGLGVADLGRIEVRGADPGGLRPPSFRLPPIQPVSGTVPGWVSRLLGNRLRPRPAVLRARCELCEVCVEACPADVMRRVDERIEIDYARCISCFCCQEMCPHKAIQINRSWISRMLFG
jgi:uncharacterized protein (DUF362 family)/Pyruvate/2-oxoacid:ferredoxin oxidoreductase delta subunit